MNIYLPTAQSTRIKIVRFRITNLDLYWPGAAIFSKFNPLPPIWRGPAIAKLDMSLGVGRVVSAYPGHPKFRKCRPTLGVGRVGAERRILTNYLVYRRREDVQIRSRTRSSIASASPAGVPVQGMVSKDSIVAGAP